jgi:hypothetical protein
VLALRYYLVVYFRVSIGRVAAAALIGLALGFYVHHDFVAWSQRGREAFMAYEGQRFDRFFIQPRSIVATMIVSVVVASAFIGLYELLAVGIVKSFGSNRSNGTK